MHTDMQSFIQNLALPRNCEKEMILTLTRENNAARLLLSAIIIIKHSIYGSLWSIEKGNLALSIGARKKMIQILFYASMRNVGHETF